MIPLDIQLLIFTIVALTGVLLGGWYDLNRAAREKFRWRGPLGDLQDIILWGGGVALVLTGLLLGNWGEFRLYVIVGLGFGIWLYMALASPVLLRWWRWWFGLLHRGTRACQIAGRRLLARLRPPSDA